MAVGAHFQCVQCWRTSYQENCCRDWRCFLCSHHGPAAAPTSERFWNLRWLHQRFYMYHLFTSSYTDLYQQFEPIIECAWILTIIYWFESRNWLAPRSLMGHYNSRWAPQKASAILIRMNNRYCKNKMAGSCGHDSKEFAPIWYRNVIFEDINYQ